MRIVATLITSAMLASGGLSWAAAPEETPRPLPLTRPELKRLIEDVKVRTPRIPLPELSEEEKEKIGTQADSYESRLRFHYMSGIDDGRGGNPMGRGGQPGGTPGTNRTGRGGQENEPGMTLDNAFKVELFWIVSRVNNCQYCLGHQESKLLAAGLDEDRIAALDSDWSRFTPAEQAAFAFARKFTFEPHLLSDGDIAGLKKHYTDLQILEMVMSMAGNNSINRWKEGVGVPQRKDEGGYSRVGRTDPTAPLDPAAAKLPRGTYLTPTSPAFEKQVSKIVPFVVDAKTGEPTHATVCDRPTLESREKVEQMLAACRQRESRLPLVAEDAAHKILGETWSNTARLPQWARLLVNFPRSGVSRSNSFRSSEQKGDLSPLLKSQLSWIIARQDRAWYATGQAQNRLRKAGQSDDQIYALDGDWKEFTPREQALFTVAKKLAASPVVLTDVEVAKAVELAGPRDVVQTISYTTNCASFDRITEAAGLQLEP